jgi:hypothetical protein
MSLTWGDAQVNSWCRSGGAPLVSGGAPDRSGAEAFGRQLAWRDFFYR